MLGLFGLFGRAAELERGMISKRTKDALAAVKARGKKKLGGYRGGKLPDAELATAARRATADAFAERVGPIAREMRDAGRSLRQIAVELEGQGIQSARGGTWTAAAVVGIAGLFGRLDILGNAA